MSKDTFDQSVRGRDGYFASREGWDPVNERGRELDFGAPLRRELKNKGGSSRPALEPKW